jgi:plasmid maintenance system antidote protein VapI
MKNEETAVGSDHGHPERGRSVISETAVRLACYLGNRAQFRLDRQGPYDIALVEPGKAE